MLGHQHRGAARRWNNDDLADIRSGQASRALSTGSIPTRVANLSPVIEQVPATLLTGQASQIVARITNTGPGTSAAEPDPNSAPGNHVTIEDDQKTATITINAPAVVPAPTVITRVKATSVSLNVKRVKRVLAINGIVTLPAGATCDGGVRVTIKHGIRTLGSRSVSVKAIGANCSYTATLRLARAVKRGTVSVNATFSGNTRLLPTSAKPRSLRIG